MEVGIRELKAHLSDYVRRAQGGEVVLITDRGKPVARLTRCADNDGMSPAVRRGIEEGWILPRVLAEPLKPSTVSLRFAGGMTSAQVIADDRDGR